MKKNLPALNTPTVAPAGDIPRELIAAMAAAVGKNLVAYIEVMYPEAIKATSSSFKLSVRGHVHNDIVHVSTLHTQAEIRKWLADKASFNKKWVAQWRKMRRQEAAREASPQSNSH